MFIKLISSPLFKGLSIISAIITIVLFIADKFHPAKPRLEIYLEEKSNVFGNSPEELPFKITFDTTEIAIKHNRIYFFKFKIVNNGRKAIGSDHYHELGIKLINNRFLTNPRVNNHTPPISTSEISLNVHGDSIIGITKSIFNPKDFIEFSFISLTSGVDSIQFFPFGKILAQGSIQLFTAESANTLEAVFREPITVHLFRLILYGFLILALLGIVFIVICFLQMITRHLDKRKRMSKVKSFKKIKNYVYVRSHDIVFSKYIEQGLDKLSDYYKYLDKFDGLEYQLNRYKLTEDFINKTFDKAEFNSMSESKIKYLLLSKDLIVDGYIYFEDQKLIRDERQFSFLEEFLMKIPKLSKKNNR